MEIQEISKQYFGRIDYLDIELIIAHAIKKPREFVLSHPEYKIAESQKSKVESYLSRRIKCEPLAYILEEKEFYGLKFKVDRNTLVPRPETEQIVELVLKSLKNKKVGNVNVVDVGTGSGNIIIALAHSIKPKAWSKFKFFGIDISKKALQTAKQNAKLKKLEKKIKFMHGNMLSPIIKKYSMKHVPCSIIITANLPYLSPKIYASCSKDIKKYEPKSALISQKKGLAHYERLLKQIKNQKIAMHVFMEISPEQKSNIFRLIKKYFPPPAGESKIIFHKDLSGKLRVCELKISN